MYFLVAKLYNTSRIAIATKHSQRYTMLVEVEVENLDIRSKEVCQFFLQLTNSSSIKYSLRYYNCHHRCNYTAHLPKHSIKMYLVDGLFSRKCVRPVVRKKYIYSYMDGVPNETFMMGIKGSSASKYVYNVGWYLCASYLEKLLNVFYLYLEVG